MARRILVGQAYRRPVLRRVQQQLEARFDGWSLAAERPLPGAWRDPGSGEIEYDQSWRHEVGIAPVLRCR